MSFWHARVRRTPRTCQQRLTYSDVFEIKLVMFKMWINKLANGYWLQWFFSSWKLFNWRASWLFCFVTAWYGRYLMSYLKKTITNTNLLSFCMHSFTISILRNLNAMTEWVSETLILEDEAMWATGSDINAHLHDVRVRQIDRSLTTSTTAHAGVTHRLLRVSAFQHDGILVARCSSCQPAGNWHGSVPATDAAARWRAMLWRTVLLPSPTCCTHNIPVRTLILALVSIQFTAFLYSFIFLRKLKFNFHTVLKKLIYSLLYNFCFVLVRQMQWY